MDRGAQTRRSGADLAVHPSNAGRPIAPQLSGPGFRHSYPVDRGVSLGTGAFCRHPPVAFHPADCRSGRIPGKTGLYLCADHRFEPCPAVDATSHLAPARHCRFRGTGDRALPPNTGRPVAGDGDAGADGQCHRHEFRDRVVWPGHRGIGGDTGDRFSAAARQQDPPNARSGR
ncbi:hypothetical protein D3C81_1775770 [compost metagenome]